MNKTLISEYSYPHKLVKSVQRANIPYHPVFYSSDCPMTAVLETIRNKDKVDPNTNYYLSKWDLKPNIQFRISPFLFGNMAASSPYKSMSDNNISIIDERLKAYSYDEIEGVKKIMQFLSSLFIYENTYVVSSFIAHSYLYANDNYRSDIFIYPSHQSARERVNFAIHPNIVTEKLQLKKIYEINLEKINEDKSSCTFSPKKIGTNKDSIIYWENYSPEKHKDEIIDLSK